MAWRCRDVHSVFWIPAVSACSPSHTPTLPLSPGLRQKTKLLGADVPFHARSGQNHSLGFDFCLFGLWVEFIVLPCSHPCLTCPLAAAPPPTACGLMDSGRQPFPSGLSRAPLASCKARPVSHAPLSCLSGRLQGPQWLSALGGVPFSFPSQKFRFFTDPPPGCGPLGREDMLRGCWEWERLLEQAAHTSEWPGWAGLTF